MNLNRVSATMDMARELAPRLRQTDRDEIYSASGLCPEQTLLSAVEGSIRADAWLLDDGSVAAIAGVYPSEKSDRVGIVWMLASDEAAKFPKRLLRGNKDYVCELLDGRDIVFNYVHQKNIQAQKWLRWLGFNLGEPTPHGVLGELFMPFWLMSQQYQDSVLKTDCEVNHV
jgi:ribosomal protein S18 acetylase RimI-like enzyme